MNVFKSFWQGGYEGADHINRSGLKLSMNETNDHIRLVDADYSLLKRFNIQTVRESVGWRLVDEQGAYNFSSLSSRLAAAQKHDIQICWTFCHYGWPEDIDILSAKFISRFAAVCYELANYLASYSSQPPVYSPVNEISFTSWALAAGLFAHNNTELSQYSHEIKRQLVRATLAGCDAIWSADPRARILHCDPLIHIIPPSDNPEDIEAASRQAAAQYEAWDMICGRLDPELGGKPAYLDLLGANIYHDNQWEDSTHQRLYWHLGDRRRIPLHQMLLALQQRYQRPVLLAETSHVGSGRGSWINEITAEVAQAKLAGVDLCGICLYPILDRPDWEHPQRWHNSGLWDLHHEADRTSHRVLCRPYAQALLQAQRKLQRFEHFTSSLKRPPGPEASVAVIIVFSHLRWNFVYQRPQQLMSRLAEHYQILFIEEPIFNEGPACLNASSPAPNVTVYQPNLPTHAVGFHDDQIALLAPLLTNLLPDNVKPIVWFYTPMALPLLASFDPSLVIYDCMDELSAFSGAPRQMIQRESALIKRADLLLTGGPSLYEARRDRHPHCHCLPSSVDAIHFEQARDRNNRHPMQDEFGFPRLGFYGVIDERLDVSLLAALADAHPEWQIVMVGPVVKIDPATLPQRSNIHYMGQQPYQALPQFLAGWDVCLMPFALNASTRFISPTKILEYMAASLPIVSTAITDVVNPYADLVAIGESNTTFIEACEQALAMTPEQRSQLAQRMQVVVDNTSWDNTVETIVTLITDAKENLRSHSSHATSTAESLSPQQAQNIAVLMQAKAADTRNITCLIAGAGPTGLSAAYHYGAGSLVVERNDEVGGWCRSVHDNGFTFDYAGHIMFSTDPYVLEMYKTLLGDNLHWQNREAWIYSHQVYTRYPFQSALYGLPVEVVKECLTGAINARYGVEESQTTTPAATRLRPANPAPLDDCCADGLCPTEKTSGAEPQSTPRAKNFEQFIYQVWGDGIARHFALPYNRKLWTVPLNEMETSWLGGRVPLPDLAEMVEGALSPLEKPVGPNARFGYPLVGGFQALMTGFLPHLQGELHTNSEMTGLIPQAHTAIFKGGKQIHYDHLISTLPLPELIKMMGELAPEEIRNAARALQSISVRCVNLGVSHTHLQNKHWIYYPESSIFHRIFVQGNASPHCNAPGGFALTCEISYSPYKPLPYQGQALIDRCIADCIRMEVFAEDTQILAANEVDMPYAYVIYDHQRQANVTLIRRWLAQYDILLSGRYSEWEYYNSDHAFIAGKKAAEQVKALQRNLSTGQ